MDIWTAVRTVLQRSPGLEAKYLIEKVQKKTGLSRSTIYKHFSSFELRKKIYREKGHYWLEKPQPPNQRKLERIRSEMEKIKEDMLSRNSIRAFKRLELLADRLKLQPHPSELYSLGMKKLRDMYGSPVDPLKELRLIKAIIRETLKRLDL